MKRKNTCTFLITAALLPCLSRVASAQIVSGSGWTAETKTAPAMAFFQGNLYFAWKGQSTNNIWYSYGVAQQQLGATTPEAPALAATTSTLYAAWRGENDTNIYYAVNTGLGFSPGPHPRVIDGSGNYAETGSSPALAGYESTVYVAWTDAESDTIMIASYSGGPSWSSFEVTPGRTMLAPALTVYNGTLYLAWLQWGGDKVMYASLPLSDGSLSGGSWSPVSQVEGSGWSAETTLAAPALGVSTVPLGTDAGLYVAWTAANSTGTDFTVKYSQLTESGWNPPLAVPNPPDPAPANTTPALLGYNFAPGTVTMYSFNAAYMTTSDDIAEVVLQSDTVVKTACPPHCDPLMTHQ